jgi:hypothetical protein
MKEDDLDKLILNPHIPSNVKMSLIEHHAEEGLHKETGLLLAIGGIIIIGAAALLCYHPYTSLSEKTNISQTVPAQNYQHSK